MHTNGAELLHIYVQTLVLGMQTLKLASNFAKKYYPRELQSHSRFVEVFCGPQ